MQLTPPPLHQRWLFEDPTEPIAILIAAAIITLAIAKAKRNDRLLLAALTTFLTAAALYALAHFTTTTREHLIARTTTLLTATSPLDLPQLKTTLTPDATLLGPDGAAWLQLDAILNRLARFDRQNLIQQQSIAFIQAEHTTPNHARVLLDLKTTANLAGAQPTLKTLWLLTWTRTPTPNTPNTPNTPWQLQSAQWLAHPDPLGYLPDRLKLQ